MPVTDQRRLGARGSWPSVTTVVPTRDRPDLVRRAVKGVWEQDYPGPMECLVVSDQAEPEAPWIEAGDGRSLRTIRNRRTPGLAGARNSGILAAGGELVAFCDDDDEWAPSKLRRQIDLLRIRPHAVVVSCGVSIRYGKRTACRIPPGEINLRSLLRSRITAVHSSTLLFRRTDLLDRVGLVDEDLPGSYAEDYDLLLRAARLGSIAAVREPLVTVRWHPNSWFAQRWDTVASALTYMLDKHPELRRDRAGSARIYGRLAFAHAAGGARAEARRWARRSLACNWRERRAYAAIAVSSGLLPPSALLRLANSMGRGI